MRKLLTIAVLTTAVMAGPASAQYYPEHGYGRSSYAERINNNVITQLDRLHSAIRHTSAQGRLSPNEAYHLNRQLDRLHQLYQRYSWNGLTTREYRTLNYQIRQVNSQFRRELRDGGRRYHRGYRGW